MAFSGAFSSVVISPLTNGTYERLNRQPSEAESGWDSMRDTYLLRYDAGGDDVSAILAYFTFMDRAAQVSGKNMWVVSRSPRLLALGLAQVEVVSMGLLTGRGYKVSYDASAASQSGSNIITPDGNFAKVQTREGSVTASFQYISFGITPGGSNFMSALTGRAKAPPAGWAPYVSPTVWDTLVTYTYNYPNGWIYEGASMENLPGLNNVFLVTEKYAYQHAKTPS